jgi:type IV secretory pathway component VirB8
MKHLIIGFALLVSTFAAFAKYTATVPACVYLSDKAAEIQLKRQHREYNYVDRSDFISYQHHLLVNSNYTEAEKDTIREQYVYVANSVYYRDYILNPAGMKVQVYHDCMLKNDWDYLQE